MSTSALLNAETVTEDNFQITVAGASAPAAIEKVQYFPMRDEICIYADDSTSVGSAYRVTSQNVTDTSGNTVAIDDYAYIVSENDCELYDLSIVSTTYFQSVLPIASAPEGACSLQVVVTNSALTSKSAALVIVSEKADGGTSVLYRDMLTLASDERVVLSYDLNLVASESVSTRLIEY